MTSAKYASELKKLFDAPLTSAQFSKELMLLDSAKEFDVAIADFKKTPSSGNYRALQIAMFTYQQANKTTADGDYTNNVRTAIREFRKGI